MKKFVLVIFVSLMLMFMTTPVFAASGDIVDIASNNSDFSILVTALQQADLVAALQADGPFTVFAPTDAAFADLLAALDVTAEDLLAQPDLAKVLLYHVVAGKVMSTDLSEGMMAETLQGESVMISLDGGVFIDESAVVTADIEATNGVIHVIDKVLVPEAFELVMPEMIMEDVPKAGAPITTIPPTALVTALMGIGIYIAKKRF